MKIKKLLLLILVLVISSIVFAKSNTYLSKTLNNIENKKYKKAINLIQKNFKSFKQKDEITYLLAKSFENNKQYNKAITTYEYLVNNFKDSKWIQKAKFRKANILIKQKKYDKAYPILQNGLKYILNPKRRYKLSQIYLDLAKNISFQKNKRKNNYKKAIQFYKRGMKIGANKNNIKEIQYKIALCYYHLKNYYKAKSLLTEFIKEFPKSKLIKNANFYLGKIEGIMGYPYKSRTHYLKVLKKENNSNNNTLSPKILYSIAKSYNIPNPKNENNLELGVKYLRMLINKYPKHKLAPISAYEIGLSYKQFKKLTKQCLKELNYFINTYPKHNKAPIAFKIIGQIYLKENQFDKSLTYLNKFLSDYPNHPLWQKNTKTNHKYKN